MTSSPNLKKATIRTLAKAAISFRSVKTAYQHRPRLAGRPDIFIMDEATSSVDTLTESLIQKGMHELMSGRTSFIIAHRLSTIKSADQIFVIENGQIAESGNHQDLIRRRGLYYNLYTKQFRHDLESRLDPFSSTTKAENPV